MSPAQPSSPSNSEQALFPSLVTYWRSTIGLAVVFVISLLIWPPMLGGVPANPHPPTALLFFGRFHPLIVHLPIGVLIFSLVVELGGLLPSFEKQWREATLLLGFVGAAGTVFAVLFGILLSREGGYAGPDFILHQFIGIVACIGTLVTMLVRLAYAGNPQRLRLLATRLSMFATFGLLSLGAHFGGNLVHGSKYLTEFAPSFVAQTMGAMEHFLGSFVGSKPALAATSSNGTPTVFNDVILPLLDAKCNKCHNEAKSKGDLRMDTYALAIKGGENGHNIKPGKPEESLCLERMVLDEDEDDHMPPKGKDQPTKAEIALITWWIKTGAPEQMKLSEAAFPAELQATADELLKHQP